MTPKTGTSSASSIFSPECLNIFAYTSSSIMLHTFLSLIFSCASSHISLSLASKRLFLKFLILVPSFAHLAPKPLNLVPRCLNLAPRATTLAPSRSIRSVGLLDPGRPLYLTNNAAMFLFLCSLLTRASVPLTSRLSIASNSLETTGDISWRDPPII